MWEKLKGKTGKSLLKLFRCVKENGNSLVSSNKFQLSIYFSFAYLQSQTVYVGQKTGELTPLRVRSGAKVKEVKERVMKIFGVAGENQIGDCDGDDDDDESGDDDDDDDDDCCCWAPTSKDSSSIPWSKYRKKVVASSFCDFW